jgi:gluconate 2-dehydrogenase alpha chain
MATKLKEVDVVIVGLGWTGGILAKELTSVGMKVVALERGGMRKTDPDFSVPLIRDELRFAQRYGLMQNPARDTLTFRNRQTETALPMRRLGSFLPGEGVGGAGVHWNGVTWRWHEMDHAIRSHYEGRYGKAFVPADMQLQDWPISYQELEPYYDKFERTAGVSGKAGKLRGQVQAGGNVFEGSRDRDYPLPPVEPGYAQIVFAEAADKAGYHPFPRPAANASRAYTNPDGARLGACVYCGHCERFGCEANAKGSPHITVIPIAMANPNFELRTQAWVTKVLLDSTKKKATGVMYTDVTTGEEYEQPASMVALCAYAINNVHLLLLSKIGMPYDPQTQKGHVGRNYCYQPGGSGVTLFFEDKIFNPFMATGASGTVLDDFHANPAFDRGPVKAIGGATIAVGQSNGRPIGYRPVPAGTPRWGAAWKKATAKWYLRSMNIGVTNSNMPNRYNAYDLDPTYRNAFGQPLLRLTYNFTDNDRAIGQFVGQKAAEIARLLNATSVTGPGARALGDYSIVPYQSTHNTGGALMGASPRDSVVNRYLQSWDVSNVFVIGASAFPHNSAYNPTGPVGALAYWAADAIKSKYRQRPGPLV